MAPRARTKLATLAGARSAAGDVAQASGTTAVGHKCLKRELASAIGANQDRRVNHDAECNVYGFRGNGVESMNLADVSLETITAKLDAASRALSGAGLLRHYANLRVVAITWASAVNASIRRSCGAAARPSHAP